MLPTTFPLIYLASTSTVLSLILAIGWKMFGRPRHAAIWAASFAVATVWWICRVLALTVFREAVALDFASAILSIVAGALLVLGFRQRAQQPLGQVQLTAISATAIVAGLLIAGFSPGAVLRAAPQLISWAIFLGLSAATMVRRSRRPNPAERTAIAILASFALFDLAAVAWGVEAFLTDRMPSLDAFRQILLLVSPGGFMAVGLAAVFLLAADLAEDMRLLATVDPLTNVLNPRGLEQAAAQAIVESLEPVEIGHRLGPHRHLGQAQLVQPLVDVGKLGAQQLLRRFR